MFAGFNVSLSRIWFQNYYNDGIGILNAQKRKIQRNLKSLLYTQGAIDGTTLQQNWFPEIKADVFISHSHKDRKLAISLAGWLYKEMSLTAFVDSCIWGYADNLQQMINDAYCFLEYGRDGSKIYNLNDTNHCANHINMMLAISLSKMIDNTECLFFLNTPSSIHMEKELGNESYTGSPWLYYELVQSHIVRHKELGEYRQSITKDSKGQQFDESAQAVRVRYKVALDHLTELDITDLFAWLVYKKIKHTTRYPLDALYWYKDLIKEGNI